jgi:hypothetical protein
MGYLEGKEPKYYWSKDELGDGTLVYVEAVVQDRGDGSNWSGWSFMAKGMTLGEAASRAAFSVLQDIMERFLKESAGVVAGVFPRADPYTTVWD